MPSIPLPTAKYLEGQVASTGSSAADGSEVPDPAAAASEAPHGQEQEARTKWADMQDQELVDGADTQWPAGSVGPGTGESLVTDEEVAKLIGSDELSSFGGSAAGTQEETLASGQQMASADGGSETPPPNTSTTSQWIKVTAAEVQPQSTSAAAAAAEGFGAFPEPPTNTTERQPQAGDLQQVKQEQDDPPAAANAAGSKRLPTAEPADLPPTKAAAITHTAGAMQVEGSSSSPASPGAVAPSAAQQLTTRLFSQVAGAQDYTEEELYGAQRVVGVPMDPRVKAQIENVDFGHKRVQWQAAQGPHNWPRDPLEVPANRALMVYERPKRERCQTEERPGRKRVYCQNPECKKEDGTTPWTWAERSQDQNGFNNKRGHPRCSATHKGLGLSGCCIRCATEWPEGAKELATLEVTLTKQYKLFRKDKGGPPDYPQLYHEPGTDLRGDLDPLNFMLKGNNHTIEAWIKAREDALDSGAAWPPAYQRVTPWWYGPDGAQYSPSERNPAGVIYPSATAQPGGKGPQPKKRPQSSGRTAATAKGAGNVGTATQNPSGKGCGGKSNRQSTYHPQQQAR